MFEKRAQGRPCRGSGEVGRNKIVEGVREILRVGARTDFSRKDLALKIGVTPALITYYFPKKESLLEEVASPVLASYSSRLRKIVAGEGSHEAKLRNMIALLLELYGKDGRILQAYNLLRQNYVPCRGDEVDAMTSILSSFFFEWRGDEKARSFDAAVLQGAVRGMCEFAARAGANVSSQDIAVSRTSEDESRWLEPLFRLFASRIDGLAASFAGTPATV